MPDRRVVAVEPSADLPGRIAEREEDEGARPASRDQVCHAPLVEDFGNGEPESLGDLGDYPCGGFVVSLALGPDNGAVGEGGRFLDTDRATPPAHLGFVLLEDDLADFGRGDLLLLVEPPGLVAEMRRAPCHLPRALCCRDPGARLRRVALDAELPQPALAAE